MSGTDKKVPKGRTVRLSLINPSGWTAGHVVVDDIFNADAKCPMQVVLETECPCCGNWAKIMDVPVPNWSAV